MFERWERCEATVVARQARPVRAGFEPDFDIVLDVVTPSGEVARVAIHEGTFAPIGDVRSLAMGDLIGVQYDVAGRRARFDDDDPRLSRATDPFESVPAGGEVQAADAEGAFFGRTPDVLATMHTPPGGIAADPGVRLAKLQALKEQGFLTEDEYRLQRQRIIDTF